MNKDYIYNTEKGFHSTLKALQHMSEDEINNCELVSIYSTTKSPFGQRGVKAGYLYCYNIPA